MPWSSTFGALKALYTLCVFDYEKEDCLMDFKDWKKLSPVGDKDVYASSSLYFTNC